MNDETTTSCPHCGGTSGVRFRATEVSTWQSGWHPAEGYSREDTERVTARRTGHCIDCGRRVPVPNVPHMDRPLANHAAA